MSVSEFALSTGLTVKALCFYDESTPTPAEMDEHIGYRRCSLTQLRRAGLICVLRTAGVGLDDIRTVLDAPGRRPALLDNHAEALRRRREVEDRALAVARNDAAPPGTRPAVRELEAGPQPEVGVAMPVPAGEAVESDTGDAFGAFMQAMAEADPVPRDSFGHPCNPPAAQPRACT